MFSSVKFGAKYNLTANKIITDAFPHRDFSQTVLPCLFFGTPHATVNHIAGVTELWLARIYSKQSEARVYDHLYINDDDSAFVSPCAKWTAIEPDLEKAVEWLMKTSRELDRHCSLINSEFLATRVMYLNTDGMEKSIYPGSAFGHLFAHNTHHRGQLHAALCAAGVRDCILDAPAIIDCLSDDLVE